MEAHCSAGFWEKHGLQCGYCTPGMFDADDRAVAQDPDPDRETIRLRLSGDICRCIGYEDIVSSVERAVELMPEEKAVR